MFIEGGNITISGISQEKICMIKKARTNMFFLI